jgi:hypothetical protein
MIDIALHFLFIFHLFGGCLRKNPSVQSYLTPPIHLVLRRPRTKLEPYKAWLLQPYNDMFMISTGQVTNKKSALHELHY